MLTAMDEAIVTNCPCLLSPHTSLSSAMAGIIIKFCFNSDNELQLHLLDLTSVMMPKSS